MSGDFRLNGRWELATGLATIGARGRIGDAPESSRYVRPARPSRSDGGASAVPPERNRRKVLAMAEATIERNVLGSGEATRVWGSGRVTIRGPALAQIAQRAPAAPPPPAGGSAWLSADDVAQLILRGECAEARVSAPARFAPQAVASARQSVDRWLLEGRIFAIHELFPRYQFDGRGRPHAAVEVALGVFGRHDPLRVGNWFAAPNPYLGGKRPQELLATAPGFVVLALRRIGPGAAAPGAPRPDLTAAG